MKTTVELADDLLVAAKRRAAERRTSLRSLLEAGLRAELSSSRRPQRSRPRRIRWVTVQGGLPPGCDVANREQMHEWLRRER